MNWRVHLTTVVIFVFTVGALRLVWTNPKIILYLVLAVIAILAYGGLYLVVKAKMEEKK